MLRFFCRLTCGVHIDACPAGDRSSFSRLAAADPRPLFLARSFGVTVGEPSAAGSVTISNSGNSALTISSVSISGPEAEEFNQTNDCSTMAPGGSCTVTAVFQPSALGNRNAVLTITSNDAMSPQVTVPLSGEGIDTIAPSVTVSATPDVLQPSDKMVSVTIGGSAIDNESGIASVVITVTDEYGVYNMTVPGFGSTIQLEASRNGNDADGRQYTITAVATDQAGNAAAATAEVVVLHDEGN